MPDKRIKRLIYKTYLAMIKNSIGTKMFQDLYILTGDKNKICDAMGRGDKSCAWFVSSVLHLSGFIKSSHATVGSVIKDMEEFGWKRTKNLGREILFYGKSKGVMSILDFIGIRPMPYQIHQETDRRESII